MRKACLVLASCLSVCQAVYFAGLVRQRPPTGYVFSSGGTRTYLWECKAGTNVEWHLGAINDGRPTLSIEVYKHGPGEPWARMTGRLHSDGPVRSTVEACPHATLMHPHLAVTMQIFAQYGPSACVAGTYELRVTASGPYVFIRGPPPAPSGSFALTWHHDKLAWRENLPMGIAAFASAVVFVFAIRTLSNAVQHTADKPARNAKTAASYLVALKLVVFGMSSKMSAQWWEVQELLIMLAWMSSLVADARRFAQMDVPEVCDVTHEYGGGVYPEWNDRKWHRAWGLLMVRVGVAVAGIICTLVAGIASRRSDVGVYGAFAVAVALAFLCVWYGIGYITCPVLTLIWVGHCLALHIKKSG